MVVKAAMFDSLSRSMEKAWKMVSKDGKLSKENIAAPLKEIRRALLEADVSLPVVRRFVKKVEETALGQKVGLRTLTCARKDGASSLADALPMGSNCIYRQTSKQTPRGSQQLPRAIQPPSQQVLALTAGRQPTAGASTYCR